MESGPGKKKRVVSKRMRLFFIRCPLCSELISSRKDDDKQDESGMHDGEILDGRGMCEDWVE